VLAGILARLLRFIVGNALQEKGNKTYICVSQCKKQQNSRFFPSFCQALAKDRVTTPTKKKKN
jgi:hypothetical protein